MDPRSTPLLEVRGLGVGFTDRSGRTREVLRGVQKLQLP